MSLKLDNNLYYLNPLGLSRPLVVIPAAGYGQRVGSPPAKELMNHPHYKNLTFMDAAIQKIHEWGGEPFVITRKNKNALVEWLIQNNVSYFLIDESPEWVSTLIQSSFFWREKNLLLLPDSEFLPLNIGKLLIDDLDRYPMSVATHLVTDGQYWGTLKCEENLESPFWTFYEKYKNTSEPVSLAWGLIAFRGTLESLKFWYQYEKSQISQTGVSVSFSLILRELEQYKDLQRG